MAHYFVASDALRLLAVYSPKCASRSIRKWCEAAIEAATRRPVVDLDPFLVWHGALDRYHDYWKVFFVRDPLLRLVGFYALWVVRDPSTWCFADAQRRLTLTGKTFRQFLYTLEHVHRNRIEPQHHLVPQLRNAEHIAFDEIIAVEDLSRGLVGLNRRLGVSVATPFENQRPYDASQREPVTDRPPEWLRRHGVPAPELFYDDETRSMALELYAEDVSYYRMTTGLKICASCGDFAKPSVRS